MRKKMSTKERIRLAHDRLDEDTFDLIQRAEEYERDCENGYSHARTARVRLLRVARRYAASVDKLTRVRKCSAGSKDSSPTANGRGALSASR